MRRMFTKNQLDNEIKVVKKDISTLVDKDGNNRFAEGNLTLNTITGATKIYGKWSLSGTHLLIVFALKLENSISSQDLFYLDDLPDYIKDKIVPIAGNRIVQGSELAYDESASSSVTFYYNFGKSSSHLFIEATCTIGDDTRFTRVNIDLLIDAD